ARERRDLAVPQALETETAEHATHRRLEVVPARVLELVLRLGIALEELLVTASQARLELAHLALEISQMRGRSKGMLFHRPDRIREDLLLHETDARTAREGHVACVGRFEAGSDAEQGGLPYTIRTDEPDPIAVREAEGDVGEDKPLAEALCDR